MKKLWMGLCMAGALLASVNSASADMCSNDPHVSLKNQNCGFDAGAAWTFAPSLPGSLNSPGRTPSDDIVEYSLAGAVFSHFTDAIGTETLSGTWTVDLTTGAMIANTLTATGAENYTFKCCSCPFGTCIYTLTDHQFLLDVFNQASHPLYLVYSISLMTVISGATDGCCTTNLYDLQGGYSGLTSGGQLTQVPEPASLALLGTALAGLCGFMAFRRRRKPAA